MKNRVAVWIVLGLVGVVMSACGPLSPTGELSSTPPPLTTAPTPAPTPTPVPGRYSASWTSADTGGDTVNFSVSESVPMLLDSVANNAEAVCGDGTLFQYGGSPQNSVVVFVQMEVDSQSSLPLDVNVGGYGNYVDGNLLHFYVVSEYGKSAPSCIDASGSSGESSSVKFSLPADGYGTFSYLVIMPNVISPDNPSPETNPDVTSVVFARGTASFGPQGSTMTDSNLEGYALVTCSGSDLFSGGGNSYTTTEIAVDPSTAVSSAEGCTAGVTGS